MEPMTHTLAGALLGRSGLNRKAAYTTAAMAIAAEFPDIDTVSSFRGPVEGFVHHRGITHTFVGLPFEAAFLVACFYGLHRLRVARALRKAPPDSASAAAAVNALTIAPVRWGVLYLFTLLALCSHLLLDFTNNYGIRPFAPFHPNWYAGSIVFIFDPLLFLLLLGGVLLPSLLSLIQQEIARGGAGLRRLCSPSPARVVLCLIAGYYLLRGYEHLRAVQLVNAQSIVLSTAGAPAGSVLTPQRSQVSPDPLNPFRWLAVSDFGPAYMLSVVDTWHGSLQPFGEFERKVNTDDPTIHAALSSPLGRAYQDWSSMPWISVDRPDPQITPGQPTVVTLRDPRFMGDVAILRSRNRTPLTATIELDSSNHVVAQSLDGKLEP